MKNHPRLSVPRLLTPVALAMALAACSSNPSAPTSVDITQDPMQSAQSYLMQADSSQGSLQNDLLIMALKAAINENNNEQAQLLIKRISKQSLSEAQQAEWQLARAQLFINDEQLEQALSQLNFQAWWKLTPETWAQYHQTRADIFTALGRPFDSSRELVALADYVDNAQQEAIADQIWLNLNHYNTHTITTLTTDVSENILDGWLQLAVYMKTLNGNIPQLKNTLEQWLAENSTHPAAIYTPKAIQDILSLEIIKPTNTALLLPLSGKFAKQAQLIRDGFIMAMMNDKDRDTNATLTVIDTHAEDAADIDAQLIEKNIDFVVGPLIKANIENLHKLQQARLASIPTLALNIPDQVEEGVNTCYLALSPEQEVEQAAKYLFSQGYQYPLILAPQGNYGQRVVEAFNSEWRKYSKNKVAVNLFGDKRQLQRNINTVFGLQDSQQNIAQMDALVGIDLESQPRSRRDIDSVYIVANSAELTLIKPFIEVAINPDATPPKLFSNSRSNSGNKQYEDLSGVTYSDIPLLIHPNPQLDSQMNQLWPKNSNTERRLQALGMDAYQLMVELPQMKVVEGYSIQGKTGTLSINDQCIVQREISWAERSAL
ncbi:penicillin-binding protein activator [Vibrio aestuarianus]|nr:penicillin-binding protein activator [Vibrio aestuarianus]MDE1212268.1 penicillin-binding protein activator [Vibrio aestuarianus]MDE1216005.1 penicillin-binding protein activator [Vibrio aestuarianus]MDE1227288.1 penicillin-binding protein activator [Vibrio aestuarianus]MDE1255780.1 penicillin-binding protein activator [Vibrio aestuarianus]MDE1259375.1 penicillin-binding protein activator [Vibrio aestuarianus]